MNVGEKNIWDNNQTLTAAYKMKFSVIKTKQTTDIVQLSKIELLKQDRSIMEYPKATATVSIGQYGENEGPLNLLDHSTSTKFCNGYPPLPLDVIFSFEQPIDLASISKWQWYTANDSIARDPSTFSLSFSVDGTYWSLVDSQVDFIATDSRRAFAYEGTVKV